MNTSIPPYNNLPTASGIYKITCTANKRFYIGSAINLYSRQSVHFSTLRNNKHSNAKMQNAWNKYGEHTFTFEILELVLPMSLTAREQYWFNKLKPFGNKGFNLAPEAGSNFGRKHTPEAKEKIRQAALGNTRMLGKKRSPEAIEKTRQAKLGKKNSPEHIEKSRQGNLGHTYNRGRKHTPETIEKNRLSHLGIKQTPEAIEKRILANTGKKRTPEMRAKMSQAMLGKKHPNAIGIQNSLGYKHTPEDIERIRQASLGRKYSPEAIAKRIETRRNKKLENELP